MFYRFEKYETPIDFSTCKDGGKSSQQELRTNEIGKSSHQLEQNITITESQAGTGTST
jgi:hypothetical protein